MQRAADGNRDLPIFRELEQRMKAVRGRAFDLFNERGGLFGRELDDWLTAQREVLGWPAAELKEDDKMYEVDVSLPGAEAKGILVGADGQGDPASDRPKIRSGAAEGAQACFGDHRVRGASRSPAYTLSGSLEWRSRGVRHPRARPSAGPVPRHEPPSSRIGRSRRSTFLITCGMLQLVSRHTEQHRAGRIGWLRAAVLGANDGLVSTASLVIGVAASKASAQSVLVAGVAGLVAGAMSMAAGEYVSVSSQSDTEAADLARERQELATQPDVELVELTNIYVSRGLSRDLARQVAVQLTAGDALAVHAREELGFSDTSAARPLQAALASAATFAVGAIVPLLITLLVPDRYMTESVAGGSFVALALLGAAAATTGGAPLLKGIVRVTFWGSLAMAVTAAAGLLFGAAG